MANDRTQPSTPTLMATDFGNFELRYTPAVGVTCKPHSPNTYAASISNALMGQHEVCIHHRLRHPS